MPAGTNEEDMRGEINMKKLVLSLWISIYFGSCLFAQAYEGKIDYRGTKQPVAMIRLPYSTDPVENALKEYMTLKGFKGSSSKPFLLFRGVRLDSLDTEGSDLYFTMDPASRKEKEVTIMSLLAVKKNLDIAVRPSEDSARLVTARLFLDSLAIFTEAYNTRLQVNGQQEVLKKAQQKMNDLISDQADLDRKIRRWQTDLEHNKTDQAKALADLQSNVNSDEDSKRKSQKKVNRLIDDQGNLEKKLRKAQLDLDHNKVEQQQQQAELDKQKQGLDAVKARQNP
jgi:hypothetical protein